MKGLRLRLKGFIGYIIYDNWDVIAVKGSSVDLSDWLVKDRPKRKAQATKSPDPSQAMSQSDHSQGTEESLGALSKGSYYDDVTEDGEDDETSELSVNTITGAPDTQETEDS